MSTVCISIIVPVYNVEQYLSQCLDSIINQTLGNIEIICVNDGSTDRSLEILEEFAMRDNRIKIISQPNGGLSEARNTGIEAATGDYIAFLDSDDYIAPTMLNKLYQKSVEVRADICICDFWLYFEDKKTIQPFRDQRLYSILSNKVFLLEEFPQTIECIGAWDRIYRRAFILENNLRFPVGLIYEDHLFTCKSMAIAQRISLVNERLIYYRKNTGVSITDKEIRNDHYKFSYLEVSRKSKEFMVECGIYAVVQRYYMNYQLTYGLAHQRNFLKRKPFLRYFQEMREITTQEDFAVIERSGNPSLLRYARYLRQNKGFRAWLAYSLRGHFHRQDGYVYFLPWRTGKGIRLYKTK